MSHSCTPSPKLPQRLWGIQPISQTAVATVLPSGLSIALYTCAPSRKSGLSVTNVIVERTFPLATSHSCKLFFRLPDMNVLLSELNAELDTVSTYPMMLSRAFPLATSHSSAV